MILNSTRKLWFCDKLDLYDNILISLTYAAPSFLHLPEKNNVLDKVCY